MVTNTIFLQDEVVALLPMEKKHAEALYQVGQDPSIWQWTTEPYCLTLPNSEEWVAKCIENKEVGSQIPFVIHDKITDQIVGSTSYLNIEPKHKAIEIGFTFVTTHAQRSYVNRRCKLLLLNHAFDTLDVNRVAFQTHESNQRSRNAILGLGAKFEGVLRHNRVLPNGDLRSTAIFSILKTQWPQTKKALKKKIHPAPSFSSKENVNVRA